MSNKFEIKRLVNIEGIDCGGKTTIAMRLAEKLGFRYEHEPNFDSRYADLLNTSNLNKWQREYYFMKDRILHQAIIRENNVVLDRYILSGLAYAQAFSPEVVDALKSIYFLPNEFKRPDVIVFVDVEPAIAMKINELKRFSGDYSTHFNIKLLTDLRNCFLKHIETMKQWEIPVVIIKTEFGNIDGMTEIALKHISKYI